MVRITAKPKRGFWRGGIHHPASPTEHRFDRFTPAQWAAIQAEPNLKVEVL